MTSKRSLLPFALLLALLTRAAPADEIVEYYHLDAAGNVRVITDENGDVVERHDYYPFGEECTTGPCASNPGVGAGHPRKFTGKERDAETGLDYFGARYYGSKIGRFTTVDPVYTWNDNLLDPQRWNRYSYGLSNPLRFTDPDGRVPVPLIAAGIWAAYEVGSQLYDAYTLGTTLADPNATAGEKAAATGGFVIGAIAPGGGYGTAGKAITGKVDDAARLISKTDEAAEAAGVVYRRTDPKTGVEYIGRSKSDETFLNRQRTHDRNLATKHAYEVVDRASPGTPLRVSEESAIRSHGGPGRLANKRYEMNETTYRACGGECDKPEP